MFRPSNKCLHRLEETKPLSLTEIQHHLPHSKAPLQLSSLLKQMFQSSVEEIPQRTVSKLMNLLRIIFKNLEQRADNKNKPYQETLAQMLLLVLFSATPWFSRGLVITENNNHLLTEKRTTLLKQFLYYIL